MMQKMMQVGNDLVAQTPNMELSLAPLDQFLSMDFPARPKLLAPWLPAQGLAMIYAPRGIGKTYLGLSIGLTIAGGGSLLGWRSPAAASVVYIDGEMPAVDVQERLASLVKGQDGASELESFHLINPDLNREKGMPDLSTVEGQQRVDAALPDDTRLIIVDNLSSLVSGDENDGTVWKPIQDWTLKHRAAGRSMILIHHSGKKGSQRGTSRREDVLDTVIALRRPARYSPSQGARFEVHFEKCRGIYGDDTRPFEAQLQKNEFGAISWLKVALTNKTKTIAELLKKGLNQTEVAREMGMNKSSISRYVKKIRESESFGGS
jgi:putative DNA primase/helicase